MKINVVVGFEFCHLDECKAKDAYIEDLEQNNIALTEKCEQFLMVHHHNTKMFKKLYRLFIEQQEEIKRLTED